MDVYIEPIEPSPELYIVGAGHVGFHLARLAQRGRLPRPRRRRPREVRERASASRPPPKSSSTTSRRGSRAPNLPPHAYVVIVTRGHTNDLEALRALAPRDLRYLGLIGSRAKVARIYDALVEDQMPPELLKRVHAPIGLDIGAVTPQEIAVSILAELIAVKHGKDRDAATSMRWTPASKSQRLKSRPAS